ncbi:hypothetical protein GRI58_06710 [Porphyrobacter algicida]|uniref:Tetratricopeptide repeat protein n=1 Tax=Qipengyuania algicida TaxID=1836209 RepID=A0A845AHW5_9SPHN|nr:hypothetical protein [Qipengyuania algicida]MXP28511.1 hypothetical protein [Qipengyuania algicida]
MTIFRQQRSNRSFTKVASAFALIAGGAVAATAIATPAAAKEEKQAAKANYSKEFVAAYKPIEPLLKAETPDEAALKAAVPTLTAAVKTDDDRMAAGNTLVQIGQKTKDQALTLQGVEMMLQSGKLPADKVPALNAAAGQLAFQAKDYAKARDYLQKAVDLGYNKDDPQGLIAETYFQQKDIQGGVKYIEDAAAKLKASNQPVPADMLKRGLAMAYNNKLYDQASQMAYLYAETNPTADSWGDAIAINLNGADYSESQVYDLLRLALKVDGMRTANMYKEFIQDGDPRKQPNNVLAAIDAGVASGKLSNTDSFVATSRTTAQQRIQADKKDLAAIAKDAEAPNAKLTTVMTVADAYLDYKRFGEAEALYKKALGMPGVDTGLATTRLGIAQTEQGKTAEAEATFAKTTGKWANIAKLWSLYAAQKGAAPGSAATAPATSS